MVTGILSYNEGTTVINFRVLFLSRMLYSKCKILDDDPLNLVGISAVLRTVSCSFKHRLHGLNTVITRVNFSQCPVTLTLQLSFITN